MIIKSFAGYISLDWHLWFLRVYSSAVLFLFSFRASVEKSGIIFIILLYVLWPKPLPLLMFFLCSLSLVFWLLCDMGTFFSDPICLVFCRLLEQKPCPSLGKGYFFHDFSWNTFTRFLSWDFSYYYITIILCLVFTCFPDFVKVQLQWAHTF